MLQEKSDDSPLVTFAVFAYNQEEIVADALKAALSQEYSPMEIIFSDDCSTDRTFEIMQRYRNEYKGAHKIRLNRNVTNLGIARHVEAVARLASADFLVVAAGDDVSRSNRVAELVAHWQEVDRPHTFAIHSAFHRFDETGIEQNSEKPFFYNYPSSIIRAIYSTSHTTGATCAYSRNIFYKFPKIKFNIYNEDILLPIRVMLLGGKIFYNEKSLVFTREGSPYSKIRNIDRYTNTDSPITLIRKIRILKQIFLDAYHLHCNIFVIILIYFKLNEYRYRLIIRRKNISVFILIYSIISYELMKDVIKFKFPNAYQSYRRALFQRNSLDISS